jgi:hypothetical protein
LNCWILRLMGNLSGCVERRNCSNLRRRSQGNVLAVLLGAVVVLGLIGGALFEIADAGRQHALQTEYRDRALAGIEFDLEAIRQSVAQQFQEQAWLDVASLESNQTQALGSNQSGYYNLDLQVEAAGNQILATQSHNVGLEALNAPNDPFRGLEAVVQTLNVTANAQSMLSSATDNRFILPSMVLSPQISIRQIPSSQFTLFSSSAGFQVEAPLMPTVGRIHSEGDLVISGGAFTSLYPVTAGGNITLANNGSLLAQSAPNQPQFTFPVQSTADNHWLAMSRSVARSTILSGRDLPMSTVEAADINQMVAPNGPASAPVAQQQLLRKCTRTILENEGNISVRTASGAAASSQETEAFISYHSPNYPGGTIVLFDLSKAPPQNGRNSFYICSSDPNAIVLLLNASNLPGDITIVSPLAIAIEGGFNNQGTPKAASITAKNVSAVPLGW